MREIEGINLNANMDTIEMAGKKFFYSAYNDGGRILSVWLHKQPNQKAIAYAKGTSFFDGHARENRAYLEQVLLDQI